MSHPRAAFGLALVVFLGACHSGRPAATTAAPPRRGAETMWWRRIDVEPAAAATTTTTVASPSTVANAAPATSAPPTSVPVTVAAPTSDDACVVRIHAPSDVLFAPGSTVVELAGAAELADLVATEFAGAMHIEIDGATDSRGSEQDNLALSAARATAVADVLVAQGFDNASISTVALGEDHPFADEHGPDPESARALNRRVELIAAVPCPSTPTQST